MGAEETVLAFVAAWNALDEGRIYALMAEDIVYHNMPPKTGDRHRCVSARVLRRGRSIRANGSSSNIATRGSAVLTERLDKFTPRRISDHRAGHGDFRGRRWPHLPLARLFRHAGPEAATASMSAVSDSSHTTGLIAQFETGYYKWYVAAVLCAAQYRRHHSTAS